MNISDCYWTGTLGTYGASRGTLVADPSNDESYLAWLALNGRSEGMPWPGSGSWADLDAVLADYHLPISGMVQFTIEQLVAYASAKVAKYIAGPRAYLGLPGIAPSDIPLMCDGGKAASNLLSVQIKGTAYPTMSLPWIDDVGSVFLITGAGGVALSDAVFAYGASVYAVLATTIPQITSGTITTTAQIDALPWPA